LRKIHYQRQKNSSFSESTHPVVRVRGHRQAFPVKITRTRENVAVVGRNIPKKRRIKKRWRHENAENSAQMAKIHRVTRVAWNLPYLSWTNEFEDFCKEELQKNSDMSREARRETGGRPSMNLGTILLIVLILILVGALPTWPYSSGWGYYPSGGLGIVLVILIVLLLTGRL
jgi:hypothetical protein